MEVKQTKDYSKFKLLATNRKTNAGHVQKVKHVILQNNLSMDFPILVDKHMNILDGQHRFEALKLLDLPIHYRVAQKMSSKDIKLVNSVAKKWSNEEHLESYCAEGNKEYIQTSAFMKWSGIRAVNAAIKILTNKGSIRKDNSGARFSQSGKTMQEFKEGNFVYPNPDTEQKKFVLKLRELSQFTSHKNPFDRSFYVAVEKITEDRTFDFDRLVSKLKQYPLGVYNDANSLIDQFEKAYNYNVRENQKTILRRVK